MQTENTRSENIQRFSIVKYKGQQYVLENFKKAKPVLIRENEKGERIGLKITKDTLLEVVFYPAQLAFKYIVLGAFPIFMKDENLIDLEPAEDNNTLEAVANKRYIFKEFREAFKSGARWKAESIIPILDNHRELLTIAKRIKFWFSNEANYPETSAGYITAKEIEVAINNAEKFNQGNTE
jgi:hypothetical protein